MRDYVLMTDSCCDLTAAEVNELELTVLPLSFLMDGKTCLDTPDHRDMTPEKFFENIAAGKECSTAAVNVGQYADAMKSALDAGKDVLCICFSSALSTTYQSACIAADDLRGDYPDAKIIVVDTLAASRGQGMLICRAVRERRSKGLSIDALADFVRTEVTHLCQWFFVDDLNHLKRGGRVSAAAALAGTMLNVKPIIHVDNEGRLSPVSKVRGTKGALKALADKMDEFGFDPAKGEPIFIVHANCPEYAEQLSALLHERYGAVEISVGFIGPVIGAHTGCGTLGLFFVGSER